MPSESKWPPGTPGLHHTQRTRPSFQDQPQEGTAVTVSATGVTFTVPATGEAMFGPAPWSLGPHASAADAITAGHCPRPGDRIAVLFCGSGIAAQWIVGWWR